jgi:hypothetical protein
LPGDKMNYILSKQYKWVILAMAKPKMTLIRMISLAMLVMDRT